MKRFNICTAKTYEKDGETKKAWRQVGQMVEFPATDEKPRSFLIELHMFPATKFSVFEEKPKDGQGGDDSDF
jgi:hypothetical protein